MSRIDELKTKMKGKGFFALSPEEKEEYKKLTKDKSDDSPKDTKKTVEISSEQFRSLMERVQQLEAEKAADAQLRSPESNWEISSDKFPQKKAALRYLVDKEGKKRYIVDYKFSERRFNEKLHEMEEWYTLQLLDKLHDDGSFETIAHEIEIGNWATLDRDWLDIVDKDEKEVKKYISTVPSTDVDYENYKSSAGEDVDQYVYRKLTTYTLQFKDGTKIKLKSGMLNS